MPRALVKPGEREDQPKSCRLIKRPTLMDQPHQIKLQIICKRLVFRYMYETEIMVFSYHSRPLQMRHSDRKINELCDLCVWEQQGTW